MEYKELPEEQCKALLAELFQSLPELLEAVAPNGYRHAELFKIHHPSPEQQYKEYCRIKENIRHWQVRRNPEAVFRAHCSV